VLVGVNPSAETAELAVEVRLGPASETRLPTQEQAGVTTVSVASWCR
jgi:hypothetical protein